MVNSEKISDITKSPVELTDLRKLFTQEFSTTNWLKIKEPIMSKSKLMLIATEIGLLDDEPVKSEIAAKGAMYHKATVEGGKIICEDGSGLETLKKDDKIHYIDIGKQKDPQTLVDVTANDDFRGVIVGPEKVLPNVKGELFCRVGSGTDNMPKA